MRGQLRNHANGAPTGFARDLLRGWIKKPCALLPKHRAKLTGNVLLSHSLATKVPSTLKGLTAVFGMGTGVAPSVKLPEYFKIFDNYVSRAIGKRLKILLLYLVSGVGF